MNVQLKKFIDEMSALSEKYEFVLMNDPSGGIEVWDSDNNSLVYIHYVRNLKKYETY